MLAQEQAPIIPILNSISPMSEDLAEAVNKSLEHVKIKSGKTLVRQGEVSRNMWFLADGVAQSYIDFSTKKEEVCTRIILPNYFVVSVLSFFEGEPAIESIETITDCELYKLTWHNLAKLRLNFPEFNLHVSNIYEQYIVHLSKRELMLHYPSAEEKYSYFIKNYGSFLEVIPDKLAAIFSGMTRQTFSDLKNDNYRARKKGK